MAIFSPVYRVAQKKSALERAMDCQSSRSNHQTFLRLGTLAVLVHESQIIQRQKSHFDELHWGQRDRK